MSSAGFQIVANRIPGERIATSVRTSTVGTFTTTETIVDTITVPLVSGRTYGIFSQADAQSSVANDQVIYSLREDDAAGTRIAVTRLTCLGTNAPFPGRLYGEYTAVASGDKTFVVTMVRTVGTGNITASGGTTQKMYLYVDYLSG